MSMPFVKQVAFAAPAIVLTIGWLTLVGLAVFMKTDSVTEERSSETQLSSASMIPTPQSPQTAAMSTSPPAVTTSQDPPAPAGAPPSNVMVPLSSQAPPVRPLEQDQPAIIDANLPAPDPMPPDAGLPASQSQESNAVAPTGVPTGSPAGVPTGSPAGVPQSPPAGVPTDTVPSEAYYP